MTLNEQKRKYLCRLQELKDEQQTKIDNAIAEMRAKFEIEEVQPYKAQLEATSVTPEMNKIVTFISYLDEMIASENEVEGDENEVEESSVCVENSPEVEETSETVETVENVANEETNEFFGTGFEAISQDVADTKAKIQSAVESRTGMHTIGIPRRG